MVHRDPQFDAGLPHWVKIFCTDMYNNNFTDINIPKLFCDLIVQKI